MSLCHQTYRRCASVALVLAIVLIALPTLLNAQTAPALRPKRRVCLRMILRRLNCLLAISGGTRAATFPIKVRRPTLFICPRWSQGFGTNLSWNFTKYLSLEGNYGGDWNRYAANNARCRRAQVDFPRRWRELFRAHAARSRSFRVERYRARQWHQPLFLAAAWISKSGSRSHFRLFEADYQLERVNFSNNVRRR